MRRKGGPSAPKERSFTPLTAAAIGPPNAAARRIRWNEFSLLIKRMAGPSVLAALSSPIQNYESTSNFNRRPVVDGTVRQRPNARRVQPAAVESCAGAG